MEFMTLLLFIVLALGFGHSITFFIRWDVAWYEKLFMTAGFGLGVIPVLGVLMNLLRIQIYWPIFLVLSLIVPAYSLYRYGISTVTRRLGSLSPKLKLKKSSVFFLIVLVMSVVFFAVYHSGSFKYPYLEDDDPWLHAAGVKYVKEVRSISNTQPLYDSIGKVYLEPYPPGYDILMGILHQTNDEVIWTLKFFNVLLLSLVGVLFYFFACGFVGDRKKALLSTFFILAIPCFMSHFVWASTLAILLFFPALYAVQKIEEDWRWMIPAVIAMGSMIMTQMSNPFIFGVLLGIYIIIRSVSQKRILWRWIIAGFLGAVIGFGLFWIPAVAKFGLDATAGANSINLHDIGSINTMGAGGSLVYTWNDFIIAKTSSKMDNPIGVGIALFFLLVFSIVILLYYWIRKPRRIFSKEHVWKLIAFIWLIMAFMGIHGNRLPFPMLMPHRWWAIFAIPLALLAVEGFFGIGKVLQRFKVPKGLTYLVIIALVLMTSGYPKYVVETSYWPPGVQWGSMDELNGYLQYMKPLPADTKVFPLCSKEFKVLAFDKSAEPWDPSYISFKKEAFDSTPSSVVSWLRSRDYEFMTVDASCVREFGVNETNDKLQEFLNSTSFQPVAQTPGFFMFQI